jgi:sugar lactone lactonase YvrE
VLIHQLQRKFNKMISASHKRLYLLLLTAVIGLTGLSANAETYQSTWGPKPDPLGGVYFSSPTTMARDALGQILVTDLGNNRIVKFKAVTFNGTTSVVMTGNIGMLGSLPGQFNVPFGVAIDKQGFILVSDSANYRIQKLNPVGIPLKTWGSKGAGPGEFGLAREIAVDSKNNYYITDEFNHRVSVFDSNGKFLYQFGTYGTGPGQFRVPQGIVIDSKDHVFVADTFNHRIQELDVYGNFIAQLGTTLVCTDTSTTFCFPRSLAVDANDNLFVADTFNHKVKKYDAGLHYLYSAGAYPQPSFPNSVRTAENGTFYVTDTGNSQVIRYTENATGTGATVANVIGTARTANGQFSEPTNILVGNDKRVYVSDKLNHRIQVFDANGNFIAKWGKNGGAGGIANAGYMPGEFNQPNQLATDAQGRIYVADSYNARVQVLDNSGNWLATIGGFGFGPGQFVLPMGVATDLAGNVFVVDYWMGIISKFDPNFNFVKAWGSFGAADGQFNRPNEISVDSGGYVYIADNRNGRIQKFDNNGNFITKWGTHAGVANPDDVIGNWGSGNGELTFPQGVKVYGNTVYVSDMSNNRMEKFDLNGNYLGQWGKFGEGKGDFFNPSSFAISPTGEEYVVDMILHRVQKFKP